MKTDELITLLAHQAGPAPKALAWRRLSPALLLGWLIALATALALIGPLPAWFYATPGLWIKLLYAGALAIATGFWLGKLGQPGAVASWQPRLLLISIVLMAMAGVWVGLTANDSRAELLGKDWLGCLRNIPLFAVPALIGALWALRGLAPTHLRLCGFVAGITAGATGALAYAFTCTETSPAFVAIWYSAGILLSGGLGTMLGPKFLRW